MDSNLKTITNLKRIGLHEMWIEACECLGLNNNKEAQQTAIEDLGLYLCSAYISGALRPTASITAGVIIDNNEPELNGD